ncbi:2-hydroxychromene-2-carboxylate isomerase [Cognatishimia activa]|uniref:2-hydroxychromene-2-carboxylate isomerase n=1 Tax=Cognatishimia activa TaxID=1715691 RepID=UPI0022302DA9|nr:DsbA family protein [Cognatishimia activa]UZD91193.1 DsbA family protein [Cognatishimia activa]
MQDFQDVENQDFSVDLFWSMRSPYCYFLIDRLIELRRQYNVNIEFKVIYPIAIRDPNFFSKRASKHYRSYHLLDSSRVAERLEIPYRRPIPDPVVQVLETGKIASEQPHIHLITRLAQLAAEDGKALDFHDKISRLIWNGKTDGWNEEHHLERALMSAGFKPSEMIIRANQEAQRIDAAIDKNQALHDAAGHTGVPLFSFRGEPFFGQDRFEDLKWRLLQAGVQSQH